MTTRTLLLLLLTSSLSLWGGCKEYVDIFGDDDSAAGDDDTAMPDDDAADDDAADDDAADDDAADDDAADDDVADDDSAADLASMEVHYTFDGYYTPTTTCAEAWITDLWIFLSHDGLDLTPYQVVCNDTPIVVPDLAAGEWTVALSTVEDISVWTDLYTASAPESVQLSTGTTVVNVVLVCNENGVDDGCGGA